MMAMYRVYGGNADGQVWDEYFERETAQKAVDDAREVHGTESYEVWEVAKVVKGWK